MKQFNNLSSNGLPYFIHGQVGFLSENKVLDYAGSEVHCQRWGGGFTNNSLIGMMTGNTVKHSFHKRLV